MFFINKKTTAIILVIVFFVVLDRFFKFLAVNDFFNPSIRLLGDFFRLKFSGNYNIAFSLPLGGTSLTIFIVFIILGLVYYLLYLLRRGRFMASVFLAAIILGAASNLADRFQYGYVIDYFDLKYFTVFNLADALIVGGTFGLLWILRGLDVKQKV